MATGGGSWKAQRVGGAECCARGVSGPCPGDGAKGLQAADFGVGEDLCKRSPISFFFFWLGDEIVKNVCDGCVCLSSGVRMTRNRGLIGRMRSWRL